MNAWIPRKDTRFTRPRHRPQSEFHQESKANILLQVSPHQYPDNVRKESTERERQEVGR